jgi:hypothetical protein
METSAGKVMSASLDLREEREEEGMEILKGVICAMVDGWFCVLVEGLLGNFQNSSVVVDL